MDSILITGGTGFIGRALIPQLASNHQIISLVRNPMRHDAKIPARVIEGSFCRADDLHQLDPLDFQAVIHLAAVKAHCSEADGLAVNVLGTHELMRYALDRGCRRFVVASTIAVPGCWNPEWLPPIIPIPADQPCFARDAYGMSKWLMEQELRYLHRSRPETGMAVLRLAHVRDDQSWQPTGIPGAELEYPWLQLADVMLSDTIRAILRALDVTRRDGFSICNISAADVLSEEALATALRGFFGERHRELDLSYFEQPGKAFASVYDLTAAEQALGWSPEHSVRKRAGLPGDTDARR